MVAKFPVKVEQLMNLLIGIPARIHHSRVRKDKTRTSKRTYVYGGVRASLDNISRGSLNASDWLHLNSSLFLT